MKKKLLSGLATGIFAIAILSTQVMATHIQFFDTATIVAGITIGTDQKWNTTFDLLNDDMELWNLDTNPYTPYGTGAYSTDYFLHYVTLRIDPNNYLPQGTPSNTNLKLEVNGIEIVDWSNPISLYDWGIPTNSVVDTYGIVDANYQITVKITGLSTLGTDYIPLNNVNLEGCFDTATPVPEPATMLLFGAGLVGLVGSRLRKKKK